MTRLRQSLSLLLIAPAVLPLVYIGGIIYPYVTPKTFLLQSFGILALAIFAYLALAGQPFFYGRLRAPATWVPALLLIVAYFASFFGIDFYQSFWGLFARGDGLLTSTVITIFFYLMLLSAPTPSGVGAPTSDVGADRLFLEHLVKVVAVVAGIVAGIAVLQWATTIFGGKAWFLPPITGRIGSTLGNAAFLAGYLGMAFFVILIALRDSNGLWRSIYTSAAVLSVLAIVFAATRGTILALILAGAAALVFVAWRGEGKAMRSARYGLLALVFFAGLFFAFRTQLAQSSFEPLQRIASISFSEGTVGSRLFVWSHIITEAFQQPLTGYGAEHIAQLFDKVYDPSKIVEQWFDHSHNAFLDYFVQFGIVGLALYVALIGAFAMYALRLYRHDTYIGLLFLLLILTYAIQNFFVFDTPSSLWLLYALFALLATLLSEESAVPLSIKHLPSVVSGVVSVLIALLIIPTVILPLYANILLTRGYLFHLLDINKANAYFEQGLALHTYAGLEYGYQAYDMYTDHQAPALTGKDRIAAYDYARTLLTANFKKYPYDARTATYLGHVLDTAPPEVVVDDAFDARVLSRAIELSPLRAQPWYMTANISLRNADYQAAIRVLEEYAQKEPMLPVPRYILASLYYKLGDRTIAKKWADEALPLYREPDSAAAKPAVKYYLAIHDWTHAVQFLSDIINLEPLNYDVLYDLAKVTYLAGDPATALRIVEKLRTIDPALLTTDQNFLTTITTYEQSKK